LTLPVPTDPPKMTNPPTNLPTIEEKLPIGIPTSRYQPTTNRPTIPPTYYNLNKLPLVLTNPPTRRPKGNSNPITRQRQRQRVLQTDTIMTVQQGNNHHDNNLVTKTKALRHLRRRKLGATFIWGGSSSWTCRGCGYDNQDLVNLVSCQPFVENELLQTFGSDCVTELELRMSNDLTILMNNDMITYMHTNSSALFSNSSEVDGCLLNGDLLIYYIDKDDVANPLST
jgi:hypothetical protein